jgi:hypothetical protein
VSAAARWIGERLAGAPPELLDAMLRALPDGAPDVPTALAEGAMALYAGLREGCARREDALPLLAADALLTHALEAQAEADPAGVEALARRFGGQGRLGELASAIPGA